MGVDSFGQFGLEGGHGQALRRLAASPMGEADEVIGLGVEDRPAALPAGYVLAGGEDVAAAIG